MHLLSIVSGLTVWYWAYFTPPPSLQLKSSWSDRQVSRQPHSSLVRCTGSLAKSLSFQYLKPSSKKKKNFFSTQLQQFPASPDVLAAAAPAPRLRRLLTSQASPAAAEIYTNLFPLVQMRQYWNFSRGNLLGNQVQNKTREWGRHQKKNKKA